MDAGGAGPLRGRRRSGHAGRRCVGTARSVSWTARSQAAFRATQLVSIDAELEAVQLEHRDVEIEKERKKELKARAPTSTRSRARSPSSSPLVPSAPPPRPPPPPSPPPPLTSSPPSSTSPLAHAIARAARLLRARTHGPFQVAQGTASLATQAGYRSARSSLSSSRSDRRGDARARRPLISPLPRGHLAWPTRRAVWQATNKVAADGRLGAMSRMGAAVAARQKAEQQSARARKCSRRSSRSEGGRGARGGGGRPRPRTRPDARRRSTRFQAASARPSASRSPGASSAGRSAASTRKEKEELLQMGLHLERVQAESECCSSGSGGKRRSPESEW